VIAGRDPVGLVRRLRALGEELGIGEQIRFLGGVEHERLPFLYAGADVFVYPSSIETFGLPIIEAMACGAPVIGSNRTSVPEVMGEAGISVDPEDVRAMGEAIYRVLTEPGLRDDLCRRGLKRVGEFSWKRAARETLEVFEEAYRRRRRLISEFGDNGNGDGEHGSRKEARKCTSQVNGTIAARRHKEKSNSMVVSREFNVWHLRASLRLFVAVKYGFLWDQVEGTEDEADSA